MKQNKILFTFFISLFLLLNLFSFSQELSLNIKENPVSEPWNSSTNNPTDKTLKIKIDCNGCSPGNSASLKWKIKFDTKSTFGGEKKFDVAENIENAYDTSKEVELIIKTSFTDKDENIILLFSYTKDGTKWENEKIHEIRITNTYPAVAEFEKTNRPWDEMRVADVFIGTNFDFIDNNVKTNDWFGGFRAFIPNIKTIGKKKEHSLGLFGGFYQSKSLAQTTFPSLMRSNGVEVVDRIVRDSTPAPPDNNRRYFTIESDSIRFRYESSIKNLGLYGGFIHHWKKLSEKTKDGIFNIYTGVHFEVIRRNVISTFTLDTIRAKVRTRVLDTRGGLPSESLINPYPKLSDDSLGSFYTDFYVGLTIPLQYNWKDIMDLRLVPTFGYSNNEYRINPQNGESQKWFYLVQFDVLARLGGLGLNLGGEIRGYFPQDPPIIAVYLGSSFSIKKLADFISKK